MAATIVERLAARALALDRAQLSDDAVARGRALIVDTIGCALGAVDSPTIAGLRRTVDDVGGRPLCTVIGTTIRTSAPWAALANGAALRYLDANDYYFGRDPAHPSGNLAAVLAVAETVGASGSDVLVALAVAYDVHLAFADAAGVPNLWDRGWHHGTNAQFASAAAAARLLGCDATTTAHALAIAGSHNNTLAQLQSGTISKLKASAEATVAKGGVEAALLARHGMTGPLDLIEGRFGWTATVAGALDEAALFAPRVDRFLDVSLKPFPAVATAMAPIDAALALAAEHRIAPEAIASVVVGLPRFALATPSGRPDRRHPATRESADHSFWYCVGVALADGACGDAQFDEHRLRDPRLGALLDRIELVEDDAYTAAWPGSAGGSVRVTLVDGRTFEARRPHPPGHPANPLDRALLEAKFHAHADGVLGADRAKAALAAIDALDDCADIRDLTATLVPLP